MSTAIVRTYTEDGFVIAADGLVRSSDTRSVIDDARQKVFTFGNDRTLAYCFTGSVELGAENLPGVVAFSFITAFSAAAESISMSRSDLGVAYLGKLANAVVLDHTCAN